MTNNKISRIDQFDFLRAYGCLAIVLLHVITAWRDDPIYSESYYSSITIRTIFNNAIVPLLVRSSVPCFFMISGVLFLNSNKKVNYNYIFKHIKKIVLLLSIYGYGMAVVELIVNNRGFKSRYLLDGICNLLQEKTWSHLWYLYVLVGLYLLTPIIRDWLFKASFEECTIVVFIGLVVYSIIPTINDVAKVKITTFGLTTMRGALLWYILGPFLYNYKDKFLKHRRFLIVLLLLGAGSTSFMGVKGYFENRNLLQPYHLWIVIYSCAIFIFVLDNRYVEKLSNNKAIITISKCSLAIYLFHPIFLNCLYKAFHIFPDRYPPIVGEMLIWAIISGESIVLSLVVKRIPILKTFT